MFWDTVILCLVMSVPTGLCLLCIFYIGKDTSEEDNETHHRRK